MMREGEYDIRDDLKYDRNKNWIRIEGDTAVFGISDVGVKLAKDIAFIELPAIDAEVKAGTACGQVESAKWAGELIAPVSGRVVEVNSALSDDPSAMNRDPYSAWVAKIRMSSPAEAESLMDASACAEWIKAEILK